MSGEGKKAGASVSLLKKKREECQKRKRKRKRKRNKGTWNRAFLERAGELSLSCLWCSEKVFF